MHDDLPPRASDAVGLPLIGALREFYGLQPTPPADLFQYCVWEVISAQALPARRDLAWQALRRIPALTPDAMFRAPAKELLDAVGIAGRSREAKVEHLRAIVGEFRRHRDELSGDSLSRASTSRAARALRRLENLPRDARARAMLFALGRVVLPIDAETGRVITRLMGAPRTCATTLAKRWLKARLHADAAIYKDALIYFRHHAQHTCLDVAPHCKICPLREWCPSASSFSSAMRRDGGAP